MVDRRLTLAVALSVVVVLSAPCAGEVRAWLRTMFPGQSSAVINLAIGLAVVAASVLAVVRIRDRRVWRYAALTAALALAALSA